MNAPHYHLLAARTLTTEGRRETLCMAALGVVGEAVEVFRTKAPDIAHEKRIKEVGDVCWYLATAMDALGMDPLTTWIAEPEPAVFAWPDAASRVVEDAGAVSEAAKKHLFHARDDSALRAAIPRLAATLRAAAQVLGTDIEEVWRVNVEKLNERHPGQFSGDYAPES